MQPNFLRDAEEWFVYAETDLSIAKVSLEANPMIGAGVAYHAQQVAEKSLKGFLAAYGVQFRRIHDLEELVKQCEAIDPRFQQLTAAAIVLSPYAAEFRYPGLRLKPTDTEARAAYQHATDIRRFVRDALANPSSTPQSN